MKKYDIAEIFTDIDDKFIAGAKPEAQDHIETNSEAQKPLVLRPEPRSKTAVWKKCAAAAACLAVLAGAGGVFAVKAANPAQTSSPLDSVSLFTSDEIQPNSSPLDSVSLSTSDEVQSKLPTGDLTEPDNIKENNTSDKVNSHTEAIKNATPKSKWTDGSEFTYDGKTYKVISIQGGGSFGGDGEGNFTLGHWTDFVVGVRRDSADIIEFVAFIENRGNVPMGILSAASSPEAPILFKFDTDVNKDSHNVFTNEEFNSMPYILQPGETYYQKAAYNITEEEYMLAVCYGLCNPDRFDRPMMYKEVPSCGSTYRWADFSDKSVDDDDVYKLFGSSNLSKKLAAAAKRDKEFGGCDDDPGFSN